MKLKRTMIALVLTLTMLAAVMPAFAQVEEKPLVVAYADFSQKFSPFFADTGYDQDVVSMTQISLMTTDRSGGIIYDAIEGETHNYNGTDYLYTGPADLTVDFDEEANVTTYTAKLREDLKFSDGEPVTADDVIFTYYAYLDPSYVGSTTINSYPIIGLNDYRTQTTSEVYTKYLAIADAIMEAGPDHVWAESDEWTSEQQENYWASIKEGWTADVQKIVNYVAANYASMAEDQIGYTAEEVAASDDLKVVLGMVLWGFGGVEEGVLTTASGATFNLTENEFPTVEDYYNETYAAYEGDVDTYAKTESADETDVLGNVKNQFIGYWGPKDESMSTDGIPNIAGIKKLDEYTVEVKTEGYEAPAVYSILGLSIVPLHYYGDKVMYDYENNNFGFAYGDLTGVSSKSTMPLGAGAYKYVKYDNRVVYFEANDLFYKGAPKIKYIQFKETSSDEVVSALTSGVADAGEMSGTKANFETIAKTNSNDDITGNVITTSKVDNLGYGYIGINADTVNVNGEPASEASKDLRKALATVLSAYREVAYDSYYGEAAAVINYPISNTSWAAPQPTDEDYKVAFSVDVDGNDIFTTDMNADQKYEAANEAAKGFLLAAGYTWDEATSKFTAAPEGAKLSYEVIIPGAGKGDHPSFAVLTAAKGALEQLGIDLKINDPSDANILWDALDSGEQELWTAAWGATIDPDMYQVYHSSNIVGLGGSDSNHYHIADPNLDEFIVEARQSDEQAFRKAVYKQALDTI
ncbi:MAG: ABC transporter substrate-binding protein, partial [Clostridiales bacterium]|nr:ABC transporter substrate-binding protein [Clostridiales bacterium]